MSRTDGFCGIPAVRVMTGMAGHASVGGWFSFSQEIKQKGRRANKKNRLLIILTELGMVISKLQNNTIRGQIIVLFCFLFESLICVEMILLFEVLELKIFG